jgi:hypothetical protein
MSLLREILIFLNQIGLYDVILPFLVIFILSLWLLISHFGKKDINYKKAIFIMIGLVIFGGILNFLSSIIPFVNIIAILFSIGLLIWIIVMYIKKKYLDIVHVYFFWICSFIIAFLVIAISNLLSIFYFRIGGLFRLIAIALLILGIYLTKRKKK